MTLTENGNRRNVDTLANRQTTRLPANRVAVLGMIAVERFEGLTIPVGLIVALTDLGKGIAGSAAINLFVKTLDFRPITDHRNAGKGGGCHLYRTTTRLALDGGRLLLNRLTGRNHDINCRASFFGRLRLF